jgi:fucose 4-O-acetylase-like acetyltransferase
MHSLLVMIIHGIVYSFIFSMMRYLTFDERIALFVVACIVFLWIGRGRYRRR